MSSEGIVADPNMPVLAGADLDGLYLAGGARTLSLPHDANAGRRVRLRDSGRSEASAQDGGGLKGRGWAADGWSRLRFLGLHCSFQSGADMTDDGGGTA